MKRSPTSTPAPFRTTRFNNDDAQPAPRFAPAADVNIGSVEETEDLLAPMNEQSLQDVADQVSCMNAAAASPP